MALKIETFSNVKGGNSFYKAASHPVVAKKVSLLIDRLEAAQGVAVYDPFGLYSGFAELYNLDACRFTSSFVQDVEKI